MRLTAPALRLVREDYGSSCAHSWEPTQATTSSKTSRATTKNAIGRNSSSLFMPISTSNELRPRQPSLITTGAASRVVKLESRGRQGRGHDLDSLGDIKKRSSFASPTAESLYCHRRPE